MEAGCRGRRRATAATVVPTWRGDRIHQPALLRFLIFSAVIVLAATTVIIATKGRLRRVKETAGAQAAASDLHTSRKLRFRSAPDGVDGINRAR